MGADVAKDAPSPAVDRLKGLLIVLIVIGHNALVTAAFPDLRRMLYLFHVQSFFLLSACLSKGVPDRRKLVDKLVRYEVPYLAFLLLYTLFFTLVVRRGAGLGDVPAGLARCVVAPTGEALKEVAGVYLLWFLPALVTFTLLDGALSKWAGRFAPVVAAALHVAVGCLPDPLGWEIPWFVRRAALLLFPAACARILWRRVPAGRAAWPAAAAALATGFVLARSGATDLVAGIPPATLLLEDVFLVATFFALRDLPLPAALSRGLAILGRNSFVIYLCHTLVYQALLALFRLDASAGWPVGLVVVVATIGLSLAAGRAIAAVPRLESLLFPSGWADFRAAVAPRRAA